MPRVNFARQLTSMINKLKAERQKHADALRSLDEIFEKIGITTHLAEEEEKPRSRRPPGKRRPGRSPKKANAPTTAIKKGGGRGKFKTSGNDSIMAFVKKAGKKGVTTGEIVKHWKSEGRSGDGYNTLGQLVKEKKLKRQKIEDGMGSRYTTA